MTAIEFNQPSDLSAAVSATQSLQIKQDKEEIQLQNNEESPIDEQQKAYEELKPYMDKFEKHKSLESIPLEYQVKLFEYYKQNIQSNKLAVEKAEKVISQGGCSFVPPYVLKDMVQHYQNQLEILTGAMTAPLKVRMKVKDSDDGVIVALLMMLGLSSTALLALKSDACSSLKSDHQYELLSCMGAWEAAAFVHGVALIAFYKLATTCCAERTVETQVKLLKT